MPNNSVITWKQIGVLLAMIGIFMTGGGVLYTKADKIELVKVEERCTEKVNKLEERVSDDVKEIKEKQNKIYDLLLSMKSMSSIYTYKGKK